MSSRRHRRREEISEPEEIIAIPEQVETKVSKIPVIALIILILLIVILGNKFLLSTTKTLLSNIQNYFIDEVVE